MTHSEVQTPPRFGIFCLRSAVGVTAHMARPACRSADQVLNAVNFQSSTGTGSVSPPTTSAIDRSLSNVLAPPRDSADSTRTRLLMVSPSYTGPR